MSIFNFINIEYVSKPFVLIQMSVVEIVKFFRGIRSHSGSGPLHYLGCTITHTFRHTTLDSTHLDE